jgi:hypothetical protein
MEQIGPATLIIVIFVLIGQWRVFEKAGEEGWKSLIPIYNLCKLLDISGRLWLGIFTFILLFTPIIGWIMFLVYWFNTYAELSRRFGHSSLFALGLMLFMPLFMMILGFDTSEYEE